MADHKQAQLYYNLVNYGIRTDVLECLPFEVSEVLLQFKDCYRLDSPSGVFALWVYQGREESLAYQHQLLLICRQRRTTGLIFPIELSNGCTYCKLNERSWFYLTEWQDFKKVSFSDSNQIKSMIELVVNFRRSLADSGLTFCHPERKDARNLINKTEEAVEQLRVFALLAKCRLKPTCFDRLFLQEFPLMLSEAETGLQLFEKSPYKCLNMNLTTQNIIIGDFSRGNLRLGPDKKVYCLGLKNYRWDIPIIDLAELLVKTGRSNHWDKNWFNTVIGYYQQFFPINHEEADIIRAYLQFPWSLYRLTSRYYFNKVEWPLSKFIMKFERILKDETVRRQFVMGLNLWQP
jgi:CotS family spore coat protein